MDWINQNKFKNILILLLVVLNLATVSVIWMQTAKENEPRMKEEDNRPPESAGLMKKTLNLTDAQVDQYKAMLLAYHEQAKKINDLLSEKKKAMAAELFKVSSDSTAAAVKAAEIGKLQEQAENLRFRYFSSFIAICTPAQRELLKPVVVSLYGRKPPREELKAGNPPAERREKKEPPERKEETSVRNVPPGPRDQPGPPTLDEKVTRYAERLKLTMDQQEKIRAVFSQTKKKEDELRSKEHPDKSTVDAAKEKFRKDEDNNVMKILTKEQKSEFLKMVEKRRK